VEACARRLATRVVSPSESSSLAAPRPSTVGLVSTIPPLRPKQDRGASTRRHITMPTENKSKVVKVEPLVSRPS
jgi:hypothetical protein